MTPQTVSKVVKEIEDEIAKEEERREQEEKTAHAAELREEAQETEEASSAQGETTVQDMQKRMNKPNRKRTVKSMGWYTCRKKPKRSTRQRKRQRIGPE